MVEITQNALIITLPAEDPANKLADLQSGLLFVLNDFFSHLDNTVDVESGAAYNDLIWLLRGLVTPSHPKVVEPMASQDH